jgi:hypothetical protein
MNENKWLNLQLFGGEGASGGEGGGEGATTGANDVVDAEQQRLLELGVPPSKLRNRAKKSTAPAPKAEAQPQTTEQVASADTSTQTQTEESKANATTRMSWDEIMADPEYNKKMQETVQARIKSSKGAEETLGKLTPALELLAGRYNLDPANIDYDSLSQAISNDESFYADKALEMGVSIDTARRLDQMERNNERQQREEAQTLEQQKFQQHIQGLEQQGEALKATFPNFNLREELRNPVFARMTSPSVGLSVEDAYYAVHRKEIQAASMQVAAEKTAQKISNAIQAGQRRPDENGTSGQASSVTTFDWSKASREQREAFKRRIREASARGEKLYPGKR